MALSSQRTWCSRFKRNSAIDPIPSRTLRNDIVIAGGGPVGRTLALSLATSLGPDLRIAVIDPVSGSDGHPDDARASNLSHASRRLLETIGVWSQIADEAEPILQIELTDSPLDAGVRPVLLTYDNRLPDGEPASHIVPNHRLMQGLDAVIVQVPSIEIIGGDAAVGLSPTVSGTTVRLRSGRDLATGLVVAADGRRSGLREAAGIKVVGWAYDQIGIVSAVTHERPHNGVAVQHFLPSGPFAILPLPTRNGQHRSCITWSENAAKARTVLALPDPDFLAEVDLRFGGGLGPIELDGPRQSWPLEMHLARSYVAQRFALVGDAAHGVHPIAGQGLNLALRDVAALTECIADAMRVGLDAGDGTLLARYQQWRRFDSAVSAATFDNLNRLFSRDWTLLRSAREAGLGLVDRIPALKRLIVSEAAGATGSVPKLLRGELA